MLQNISYTNGLRESSPLKPQAPKTPEPPREPNEEFRPAEQNGGPGGGPPKWALAAFAGLGLLAVGGGVAQAQVQVAQTPQQIQDQLRLLEEASIKQGIDIEYMVPSPIGGGRLIDAEQAGQRLAEGRTVLLAEVTPESGPVRGGESENLVRRQAYLTGQTELESYVRYFRGDEPQNPTEAAAQKLKKFIYTQTELTLLQRPQDHVRPGRPTLSPFAAARRLEAEQEVTVRTPADGITRSEDKEQTLNSLDDVENLVNPLPEGCTLMPDFVSGPDGTIQLVERPLCP